MYVNLSINTKNDVFVFDLVKLWFSGILDSIIHYENNSAVAEHNTSIDDLNLISCVQDLAGLSARQ